LNQRFFYYLDGDDDFCEPGYPWDVNAISVGLNAYRKQKSDETILVDFISE
jgi:hypothetical protein